jgi:threonyl-tRNA synthetase
MTDTIKITLPDSSIQDFPKGSTPNDVALSISKGLADNALVAIVNGNPVDLTYPLIHDSELKLVTYKSPEAHDILLHSTAHVMAHAVQRLFKDVKVTIGPAIENRFYYDFDTPNPFTEEDLERIEGEMKKIIADDLPVTRRIVTRDEAIRFFDQLGETYKVEIIHEIPEDEILTIYTQGEWSDLCRGPHIPSTGKIKAFKLLSVAGAYWRGDERNKMLSRIYGTSFADKKQLTDYLNFLEEAKKRDHRKLGKELDLFDISDRVGPGLALWFPKGAALRRVIEDFWYDEHRKAGYELVQSPHIGKAELWETSGHLGFYKESMYSPMDVEGQNYYIKPMNCPFHIMIYKRKQHSYRDLPLRYAELGTVYRYEMSGVLHGLMRVRGFTQDDAHIICTPDQLTNEVEKLIRFSFDYLKTFGFTEFVVYLSTRPEGKSVGDAKDWEQAQESLSNSLKKMGVNFDVDEGGGAFYGPKIDIKIKDAIGRMWQCTTIQFDFNEPERFNMEYTGSDGNKHRPFMIHRAIMGSLERFIGILIEDTAGHFPFWLAPVQVKLLPIADRHLEFVQSVEKKLFKCGIRVQIDDRQEKIGAKIRDAELNKIPFMCIIGDNEVENGQVSVRRHQKGDQGSQSLDSFIEMLENLSVPSSKE